LKEALSKDCGVPAGRMVIGEVWNHEVYRFYKPTEEIDLISTKDVIAAWEVDAEDVEVYEAHDVRGWGRSSVPSCGRLRMIFNQKRMGQRLYSSESEWKLFGIPLLLSVDAATVASVEALYKVTRQCFGLDCEDFRVSFPCRLSLASVPPSVRTAPCYIVTQNALSSALLSSFAVGVQSQLHVSGRRT
jgi:hypothetical protein